MRPHGRAKTSPEGQDGAWQIQGLAACGPDPKLKTRLALFGQFVGDWKVEVRWFKPDGTLKRKGRGEVHFGWVLEGCAIQDVWVSHKENPPRKEVAGTTIRFYDPAVGAWKCTWISPAYGVVRTFIARKRGSEIVLEGTNEVGCPERWIFSDITPRTFRWRAVESDGEKGTWRLTEEMRMHRIGGKERGPAC